MVDQQAEFESTIVQYRRRPGLKYDVSAEPIPCLHRTNSEWFGNPTDEDHDQLASARGIVIWSAILAGLMAVSIVWLWWR
jgi:hypothetical protein